MNTGQGTGGPNRTDYLRVRAVRELEEVLCVWLQSRSFNLDRKVDIIARERLPGISSFPGEVLICSDLEGDAYWNALIGQLTTATGKWNGASP